MKKYSIWIFITLLAIMLVGCNNKPSEDEKYIKIDKSEMGSVLNLYTNSEYEIKIDTNVQDYKIEINAPNAIIKGNKIRIKSTGFYTVTIMGEGVEDSFPVKVTAEPHPDTIDLYIDGVKHTVEWGRLLYRVLEGMYGGFTYEKRKEYLFDKWYLDSEKTKECDIDMKLEKNMKIYSNYISLIVEAESKIEIDNIIGYKDTFDNAANIQTFSPAYDHDVGSKDYSDYAFILFKYNLETKWYKVTQIITEGQKSNTVIPYDGGIIVIKKVGNYQKDLSKLKVGNDIRLNHYNVKTADIFYINPVKKDITPAFHYKASDVITSTFATVYDVFNQKLLFNVRGDEKAYPASTTKVITAMAALKNASLNDKITVGDELDLTWKNTNGASTAGIKKGEVWTLRQLLYALLLPSGNDAAYEIAALTIDVMEPGNTYKPMEKIVRFREEMNKVAQEVGANNSHFMSPDGNSYYNSVHDWLPMLSEHYVTTNDFAKMAEYAFAFGAIAEVVATPTKTLTPTSGKSHFWKNTNKLIRTDSGYYEPGAVGLKTGTTGPAGRCLASAVERDGRFIIVISFKNPTADSRFSNPKKLYEIAFREHAE